MEFARDLTMHLKRWLTALDVTTYEDLCNLIVLEQFKNCLPDRIAKWITEQKLTTAADAAVSADEYVLIHKSSFRERSVARDGFAPVKDSGALEEPHSQPCDRNALATFISLYLRWSCVTVGKQESPD